VLVRGNFDFDRPLLLDGGMGRELLKRGVPILTDIWSGTALIEAPDTVRQVHADFIAAGADIITTNTYGLARGRLARAGAEAQFAELHQTAARLAVEARDAAGRPVAIAGSLPPYSGSYRPDLVQPYETLLPLYAEQAEVLAPYVDLFICETMSTAGEALAAASAAVKIGKPVWIAWTLDEDRSGRLRSGETVSDAAAAVGHLPIGAFLANCCAPESITAAIPSFARIERGRFGAYANTFAPVPKDWPSYGGRKLNPSNWEEYQSAALPLRGDLDPESYASHARQWWQTGATILGGCCGAGPKHIAKLRQLLDGE
jgi:S-methylmethionine-dependent homocysteine/selenocysteine methylase